MSSVQNIYAYGYIQNEQSERFAEDWGSVSLTTIKSQLSKVPANTTEILLHIHSGGGDVFEAFAIHDYLVNCGYTVKTRAEGLCASAATIVMLAGSVREMTENSTFMIHNPVMGIAMGDADDLEDQADFLREIEDKIINFYNKKTGQSKETLDSWMKEEKFMTPDEAKELGFITDVVAEMKVAAIFPAKRTQIKKESNMEILNTINEKFEQVFLKLGIKKPEVNNDLRIHTADGKTLIVQTDKETIAVDDKVRLENGNIENGEYLMPEGEVIVVTDGVITELRTKEGEPVEDATPNDVVLNQLREEVVGLRNENTELRNQIQSLGDNITILLDNVESSFDPPGRSASFVKKETNTSASADFSEAFKRVKEKETVKK